MLIIMSSYIVFLTWLSAGLVISPCSGFFEVGVSSYLQNAVDPSPQGGWSVIGPWRATAARKGVFESTAPGQQPFSDRFITPQAGIYYVAVNLRMANATSDFLKASVIINDNFEDQNGIEGVYGNTTLEETLSLTGFLHLFEDDVLTVYLYGSVGKVLPDSMFSVVKISRLSSVPGFHAVLSRDQTVQFDWTRLEDWKTSGAKGLFQTHTGTSPSVGQFCAILTGVYQFTTNINIESDQHATTCVVAVVLNSGATLIERFSSGTENHTIGLLGIFYLDRGDCVELRVKSTSEGTLTVQRGSGFSGLFLGLKKESVPQFSASLPQPHHELQKNGWNLLNGWMKNNSRGNFQSEDGILKDNNSTFESQESGLYIVSAVININVTSPLSADPVYLLISVGGAPSGVSNNNGLLAGKASSLSPQSLSVSGVILLNKGDTVMVYIYKDADSNFTVSGQFGVSMVTYDWPGVTAILKEDIPLTSSGWTALTSWVAHNTPGLFSFDSAFSPVSGQYHANVDGVYFVSCNAILKGNGRGTVSVLIALNEVLDTGSGLYAYNSNPKHDVTLNVAGSIKVNKGQNVSVFVRVSEMSSWTVSIATGFSLALIGAESLSVTGFSATKQDNSKFNSSSWQEIGGWSPPVPDGYPLFQTGNQFSPDLGRFQATEDGLYLVCVNILLSHPGSVRFDMKMARGGNTGSNYALEYFLQEETSSPVVNFVNTLTLAGIAHLTQGQNISIFIKPKSSVSWTILANSSFSVVLVSRWTSVYGAGFLAFSHSPFSDKGFVELPYWDDSAHSDDNYADLFGKNLRARDVARVTILDTGLYFVQSVVYITDRVGNVTFQSGVCLDGEFALRGLTASKKGEGRDFVISAFGVLHLRKDQRVSICTNSSYSLIVSEDYTANTGGGFSMAKFLSFGKVPGLHQHSPSPLQHASNSLSPCKSLVIRSWSTGGDRLSYISNNIFNPNPVLPSDKGDFTATLTGRYFISIILTLLADATGNVHTCVGPQNCTSCYISFSSALQKQTTSIGFVGLVNLVKDEAISICLNSNDEGVALVRATRSVQFWSDENANATVHRHHEPAVFSSSGGHGLLEWKDASGDTSPNITVLKNGLYILCTNLGLRTEGQSIVGMKLDVIGSSSREVLSVSSSTEADVAVSFSVAVIARLDTSEAVSVSVYSNSSSWNTPTNASFFAALVSEDTQSSCFSVRSRPSSYNSGVWWTPIRPWEKIDLQCVSPYSDHDEGRFVANEAGVYFLAAVVVVRASGSSSLQERTIELLLSVNGDAVNNNGLKVTRTVKDGSLAVLSLSASVYLDQWQTLYPMIRSTGGGTFQVVNGSTFSLVLIDKKRFYNSVATDVSHFDNGPRVIRHPPPSVRLPGDLGSNVSWTCEAVAKQNVEYKWLKDNQHISPSQGLVLPNVAVSDSGRYFCVAESDNIKVTSQAARLEVFDTTPQLAADSSHVIVPENEVVSVELRFSAVNQQGSPTNVSIRITEGNTNDTFALLPTNSSQRVILRNEHQLDYENTNLYVLTLVATNEETKKNATVNVTVAVTDFNDNPPVFDRRYYNTSVLENATIGTPIFQANATDKDSANISTVSYSFVSGDMVNTFAINSTSGNVTVVGGLDRETTCEVTLCIQATDGKYTAVTKLLVTILDVNEFPPVFVPQNYTRRVSETALIGEPIIQVFASDRDTEGVNKIVYEITSGDVNDTFTIDADNGTVRIQNPLDYESIQSYELRVQASDGEFTSRDLANVVIQVVDSNDNRPVFEQPMYSFSVLENATVGSLVGRVNASDQDSYENGNLTYFISIVGDYEKFDINSSTGEIFIAAELDFEITKNYVILVDARDGGDPPRVATTLVNISARDINDNPPECRPCEYSASITEATTVGTPVVRVFFKDKDSMAHSQLLYTISNGNVNETFNITRQGVVLLQKQLDRETVPTYNLTVDAQNTGASALKSRDPATIIITVVDVNDHSPVFEQPSYSFSVLENATVGFLVGRVNASDQDSYENGKITYFISMVGDNEKFDINSSTGEIFIAAELDFERAKNYVILVDARDGGDPPRTAATLVNISARDINDNPPECRPCEYSASITEATTIGTPVVRIFFKDQDAMPHSLLVYTISNGNVNETFNITEEGVIFVQEQLDRETAPMYNLTVDAQNTGANALKSRDPANIIITVADVNDNYPQFSPQSYSGTVSEDVDVGFSILEVKAEDTDTGLNAHITYSLADNPYNTIVSDIFSVNATSGSITTLKKLEWRSSQSEYTFQVKASDHGNPRLLSFANVRITVLDVNDSPPVFTKPVYEEVFEERPALGIPLVRVMVSDGDQGVNAHHALSILSVYTSVETCTANFTVTSDGNISAESSLQYGCTYNITVLAEDQAGTDTCSVVISVEDAPTEGNSGSQSGSGFISKGGEVALIVLLIVSCLLLLVIVIWIAKWRGRASSVRPSTNPCSAKRNYGVSQPKSQSYEMGSKEEARA